jgi:hypothetical protein
MSNHSKNLNNLINTTPSLNIMQYDSLIKNILNDRKSNNIINNIEKNQQKSLYKNPSYKLKTNPISDTIN